MATATGYSSFFNSSNLILIMRLKFIGITPPPVNLMGFISRGWVVDEFDERVSGLLCSFWKIHSLFHSFLDGIQKYSGIFLWRFFKQFSSSLSMNHYWALLQRSRSFYIIALSLVTTVLFVNTLVDFVENLIRNPSLYYFSFFIFCLLLLITVRKELWKHVE